jgi:hypothetical protein
MAHLKFTIMKSWLAEIYFYIGAAKEFCFSGLNEAV